MSDAEREYSQWLADDPNKTICTHWREAFRDGYAAASASLDSLLLATAEATLKQSQDAMGTWWPDEGGVETFNACMRSIRALDLPAIVARVKAPR